MMELGWLFLPLTVAVYFFALKLYKKTKFLLFNPVIFSIICFTLLLLWLEIPYSTYLQGGKWIGWFLEPSVVALGLPLYLQRKELKRDLVKLLTCTALASFLAISSVLLLAMWFGLDKQTAISISPKSITTAIAVVVSEQQGGTPALSAVSVSFAGVFGVLFAIPIMKLCGIKSPKAQGLAMGASSHALGTARIKEDGELQGAYSALSLVLCAIFTAILLPILLKIFLPMIGN